MYIYCICVCLFVCSVACNYATHPPYSACLPVTPLTLTCNICAQSLLRYSCHKFRLCGTLINLLWAAFQKDYLPLISRVCL